MQFPVRMQTVDFMDHILRVPRFYALLIPICLCCIEQAAYPVRRSPVFIFLDQLFFGNLNVCLYSDSKRKTSLKEEKKMEIYYQTQGTQKTVDVTDFYKDVAAMLSKEPSGTVKVICGTAGEVNYSIRERSGTRFITENCNTLPDSILDDSYPSRYLTCVDEGRNAYKFYKLEPCGNEVKASYGRMGVAKGALFGERSYMYPLSMFWVKYYEKLSKGYIDNSDVYLTPDATTRKPEKPEETCEKQAESASARLFAILQRFSKTAVREARVSVPITHAILKKSESLIGKMRTAKTTEEFNDSLLQLIAILQRPVRTGDGSGIRDLIAKSTNDFPRILQRESDLLMAMDGMTTHQGSMPNDFESSGIEVYEATEKQKKQVLSKLSDSLRPKVKNIYRVIPKAQQARFDQYLKKHGIKTVKQLWHGSRNQNWISIIRNGLLLKPDAIITGKMFSDGIYFAPSSMKSWNYTSYHGTSWANGHDDCAFMGLYATAYGTPWDVHTWSGSINYRTETLGKGADCLHAHAGNALRNDEIVFYDESATVLNYIVEFR